MYYPRYCRSVSCNKPKEDVLVRCLFVKPACSRVQHSFMHEEFCLLWRCSLPTDHFTAVVFSVYFHMWGFPELLGRKPCDISVELWLWSCDILLILLSVYSSLFLNASVVLSGLCMIRVLVVWPVYGSTWQCLLSLHMSGPSEQKSLEAEQK